MKITVKRSKTAVGNFMFGEVFFSDDAYWLVTSQPCSGEDDFLCINIATGEGRYFDRYEAVEIVNGEFTIQG